MRAVVAKDVKFGSGNSKPLPGKIINSPSNERPGVIRKTKYNVPKTCAIYKYALVTRTQDIAGRAQSKRKTWGSCSKNFK